MNDAAVLECINVCKAYREGKMETPVLKDVSFTIDAGESVSIMGASGSGKSTLLHVLGGLDDADQGQVIIASQRMDQLNDVQRGRLRNQHVGFVYQFHHLMSEFTALENVAMPLLLTDMNMDDIQRAATDMLERMGLAHRLEHKPGELSGGERQRTAIARALVTRPSVLLADEPTGNLDSKNAQQVFDLLLECKQDLGTALVIVTHDKNLAAKMDCQLELIDGVLNT